MILTALAALLAFASSPTHASFTQDDRYFDSRAPTAAPVKAKGRKAKPLIRKPDRLHVKGYQQYAKKVVSRRVILPHDRITLTMADEQSLSRRETVHYAPQEASVPITFSGPRPRAWCGWWLGRQLGMLSRTLWLARNWAHVGTPTTKQTGAIVVWRHHVGKITAVRADGAIKVLSGNDGRAVRDRWRSARGVIAYRML